MWPAAERASGWTSEAKARAWKTSLQNIKSRATSHLASRPRTVTAHAQARERIVSKSVAEDVNVAFAIFSTRDCAGGCLCSGVCMARDDRFRPLMLAGCSVNTCRCCAWRPLRQEQAHQM